MMAYQSGFCVSLIHNNKPQREFNEGGVRTVKLPFGSEYSLKLKSTHMGRTLAEVTLDGVNISAMGEGKFIIPANDSTTIERFVGDLNQGKKFKFESLEKAAREGTAQDPTSAENGLIRVRFWKERMFAFNTTIVHHTSQNSLLRGGFSGSSAGPNNTLEGDSRCWEPSSTTFNATSLIGDAYAANVGATLSAGTTVEGSASSQKFAVGENFEVESTFTEIVIKLQGLEVEKPAVWLVGGGIGALQVFYRGQLLEGIKEIRHSQDGLMVMLDPKRVVLQR